MCSNGTFLQPLKMKNEKWEEIGPKERVKNERKAIKVEQIKNEWKVSYLATPPAPHTHTHLKKNTLVLTSVATNIRIIRI